MSKKLRRKSAYRELITQAFVMVRWGVRYGVSDSFLQERIENHGKGYQDTFLEHIVNPLNINLLNENDLDFSKGEEPVVLERECVRLHRNSQGVVSELMAQLGINTSVRNTSLTKKWHSLWIGRLPLLCSFGAQSSETFSTNCHVAGPSMLVWMIPDFTPCDFFLPVRSCVGQYVLPLPIMLQAIQESSTAATTNIGRYTLQNRSGSPLGCVPSDLHL
ncbi:hypothetical protein TNCV_1774211 [Trichonephila clavipes]|nr:hypothetical protein TNCV_1774211 [Trichonephila clavipes]